jgi:hypothetical protein
MFLSPDLGFGGVLSPILSQATPIQFPAELKTAMEGAPWPIQLGVSAAVFFLTIVVSLGMVKWARRTEPKAVSNDVVLPGLNASIMDMNPVRDLARSVDQLTSAVDRNTKEMASTSESLRSYVARQLEEEYVERKAQSLFEHWARQREERPNRRPRT